MKVLLMAVALAAMLVAIVVAIVIQRRRELATSSARDDLGSPARPAGETFPGPKPVWEPGPSRGNTPPVWAPQGFNPPADPTPPVIPREVVSVSEVISEGEPLSEGLLGEGLAKGIFENLSAESPTPPFPPSSGEPPLVVPAPLSSHEARVVHRSNLIDDLESEVPTEWLLMTPVDALGAWPAGGMVPPLERDSEAPPVPDTEHPFQPPASATAPAPAPAPEDPPDTPQGPSAPNPFRPKP